MSGTLTTASSSSSFKVLSLQSIEVLRARGEGGQQGGYRDVSNTSYATADSLDSEATVLIPDELDSPETLQFLELNEQTVPIVWQQFLDLRDQFPQWATIIDSAKRHVIAIRGDPMNDDDNEWVEVMRRIGLSSNFQARIMRDDMREMRLSGSLKEWVIEMMETRYDFLRTLDNIILAPPASTLGRKTSKPTLDGSFSTQPAPAIPPRVSSNAGQGPKLGVFEAPKPGVATVADDPPKQLDGHVMLLRGAARPYLINLFTTNGQLNFGAIGSIPPGDFSKSFRGLYFTKNYKEAWQYAQWRHVLADGNVVPVEILHVAVPQALMASAKELYGEEWTRFVWASRRDNEKIPDDLKALRDYQWLIGAINHSSHRQVEKMTSPSELQIWKLAHNQTATQFFASNDAIIGLLDQHCVGKVWRTAVHVEKKAKKNA